MTSVVVGSRANSIDVKGKLVAHDGAPCKSVRVEIVLRQPSGVGRVAGALVTNEDGAFDGKIALPSDLPLADYAIVANTPGAGHCGPAASE